MMLTLTLPMLAQVPAGDPFRRMMVLAVPFAANIGGIGTPIASPPNAVALGFVQKAGRTIPFLEWMLAAVPLMIGLLLAAWAILWCFFRPRLRELQRRPDAEPLSRRGWFVVAVFAITVMLWMTDTWHGLPAAVVALLPAVAFTITGVLDHHDVNSVEWNILILIGGGIALGAGMQLTGLDKVLLGYLPVAGVSATVLVAMLAAVTVLLGTFMSNTATANLILPIGISSAAAFGADVSVLMAFSIALAASMSMSLPISTPPNAMAYGTGEVSTRDMLLAGTCIAALGTLVVALLSRPMLRLWGIVP
jgi:solute carrier family 13 (sodium-dependent dicarboxylate transporter), member 2/3/5